MAVVRSIALGLGLFSMSSLAFTAAWAPDAAAAGPRRGGPAAVMPAQAEPEVSAPMPEDPEAPAISDDVIVSVLVQTNRVIQAFTAVGAAKPPGTIRNASTHIHGDLNKMVRSLDGYAKSRGFSTDASQRTPPAAAVHPEMAELISELRTMDDQHFNPAYLSILHGFLGEMVSIVRGAHELAEDPKLKTMLSKMEADLVFHRDATGGLLMKEAMPEGGAAPMPRAPGGAGSHDVPAPTPL